MSPISFFIFVLLSPILCEAQDEESAFEYHNCSNTATYAPNSTYARNLNLLLSSLPSNASALGFHHLTVGGNTSYAVYGLFLCRGDVSGSACRDCVQNAAQEIVNQCPNQKTAIIWTAGCMLRYSNHSIFSSMQESPGLFYYMSANVTNPESFMELLRKTLSGLVAQVVAVGRAAVREKFATKEVRVNSLQTLYSLAQCTPDLTAGDCEKCLKATVAEFPIYCSASRLCRALFPSCLVWYDLSPFYQIAATPQPPAPLLLPPTGRNPTGKSIFSPQIFVIAVSSIVAFSVICFMVYCLLHKRVTNDAFKEESVGRITNLRSLEFKFISIEAATNNFSDDNKLGQGGFGSVYKGTLPDGQEVAVKKLSKNSGQGAKEFKNEIALVAKLQHKNLVRLLGFCLERKEKMLVYEYVCNKSLDHFLYDTNKKELLDWPRRRMIMLDIARGILYLHEDSRLTIIHRDLKSSNILLDENMNAKIADFGIARIFRGNESHERTRNIAGTHGYMAPEYAMRGQFSLKSDVFSFGVILLEIITGKKNNCIFETDSAENLISYAWKHWSEGTPMKLMDPALRETYSEKEVIRCIHVGLLCVQEKAAERPIMASVLLMLNRYFALPSPQRPAFLLRSRTDHWKRQIEPVQNSTHSLDNLVPCSVNKLTITELYPRD